MIITTKQVKRRCETRCYTVDMRLPCHVLSNCLLFQSHVFVLSYPNDNSLASPEQPHVTNCTELISRSAASDCQDAAYSRPMHPDPAASVSSPAAGAQTTPRTHLTPPNLVRTTRSPPTRPAAHAVPSHPASPHTHCGLWTAPRGRVTATVRARRAGQVTTSRSWGSSRASAGSSRTSAARR